MRAAAVAGVLALLLPSIAAAQPGYAPPPPPPDDGQSEDSHYSNPGTATALAVLWSGIGIGTLALGAKMRAGGDTPILVLGGAVTLALPSAGHWWADGGLRFTPGLGVRLAGMTMMGVGFGSALDRGCDTTTHICKAPIRDGVSDSLLLGGAALVLGGMVWDIATAGHEAEAHNARVYARRHAYASVAPTVMQAANGSISPGLGVNGAF